MNRLSLVLAALAALALPGCMEDSAPPAVATPPPAGHAAPLPTQGMNGSRTADFSNVAVSGALVGPPRKITSVEGITEYQLPDGLTVLMFPDNSKDTATVNMTYVVGSRNEGYGETGMAHLLEHMMFKGSTHHPHVPDELTSHGSRPNGTTSYDRTNYFETFAATSENLDWALDLEADRMVNSFIKKSDLWGEDGRSGEMTVVRNEFEVDENDPSRVLSERLLSTAYLWHHYGHSVIGARSDVENVPVDRLKAFYQTYYQPDNAVLTVAGKFDEAKTLDLIARKFAAVPRPARVLQKSYTVEPTQDGERTVTLRRVGETQEVLVGYHVSAGSSPDFAAVRLLAFALGDSPSGRLYKALVDTKKASSVFGYAQAQREPGMVIFGAEVPKDGNLDEVRNILVKTVEEAVKNPPTTGEIDRGRQAFLKEIDLTLRDSGRVGLQLSNWISMGDWRLFFLNRDRVKAATPAEVADVATHYLKSSNRTTAEFFPTEKPDRAEIPPTPDVDAMVKDYKGGAAISQGEAFDPSPANVDARTHRSTIGRGLKVALLPKKTRGDTVRLQLILRFGDEKSLFGHKEAAGLTGSMLDRGTTKHTRQELKDAIDKLGARVSVDGGGATAYATIEATREKLGPAFRLAVEMLREPTFPANELETLKAEEITALEEQKSDPRARASLAFQRHVYPYPAGDIRYNDTPDEAIAALKKTGVSDLKAFWKEFYGASDGELAVVGDFDEGEITRLATELLGDWKSPKSYTRIASVYQDIPVAKDVIETPDKASAVWIGGERVAMRDDDADYPAMVLGNYILGGGFLNSRLATRIRQKDGLSYGVGSGFNASPLDKDGAFTTFAIYAPQNREKLEKAFGEELHRALEGGFTAEELATAKSGWLQSRNVSRSNDQELVASEATHLYIDRKYAWDGDFEKKVSALTPDQVVEAMRRHLDLSKLTEIKAGDFAGAAAKAKDGAEGAGKSGSSGGGAR